MDEWLSGARDALAAASGVPPADLELDRDAESILLELARIAAHESSARINAPLLCYLVGRAQREDASLENLAEAVKRVSQ